MSYIAFDLDALNAAPNVARAARVSEDTIIGGLLRLWAHAFRCKAAELDELEVRGCFDSQVDVMPALKAFGFLAEASAGRLRVRGADRYLRISEARSRGGKAASGNLKRGTRQPEAQPELPPGSTPAQAGRQPEVSPGSFPALTPSTEHRTPIEKNVRTSEADQLDDAVTLDMRRPPVNANVEPPKKRNPRPCAIIDTTAEPVPVVAGPVVYARPTSEPSTWLAEDFWAWAQSQRQDLGLLGERQPPRGLAAWWSTARMTTSAEALQAAFVRFTVDPHWAKATPPAPFAGWLKQWDRFVTAEPVSRTPPRVDADVWAELRGRTLELENGGLLAQQLEQLRWSRERQGFVGSTEDGFHAAFLVERFGGLLEQLGVSVDASTGGAA